MTFPTKKNAGLQGGCWCYNWWFDVYFVGKKGRDKPYQDIDGGISSYTKPRDSEVELEVWKRHSGFDISGFQE